MKADLLWRDNATNTTGIAGDNTIVIKLDHLCRYTITLWIGDRRKRPRVMGLDSTLGEAMSLAEAMLDDAT